MSSDLEIPEGAGDAALLFIVTPPSGLYFSVEVVEGMTIGSAPDASVRIFETGVEAHHVLIRADDDGLLEAYSRPGIWTETGELCSSLPIVSGSRFRVGMYSIACVEVSMEQVRKMRRPQPANFQDTPIPPLIAADQHANEELVLQVHEAGAEAVHVSLRAGQVIGSNPNADIMIKHPAVGQTHGTIRLREDGQFELQVPAGLELSNGCICTSLLMTAGTKFTIGDCDFACVYISRAVAVENRSRFHAYFDSSLRCPQCRSEISLLPTTASFCPWCGHRIANIVELFASIVAEEEKKASEAAGKPATPPTGHYLQKFAQFMSASTGGAAPPDGQTHSLMLLGYGNALFNLGWQYESGAGRFKNLREALRYYRKSARLGNPVAQARAVAAGSDCATSAEAVPQEDADSAQ